LPQAPQFASLRRYVSEADPAQALEMARQLARCFDRYLIFRPDWIREWEAGEGEHWQAELWRQLVSKRRPLHWVHALDAFRNAVDAGAELRLPERVTLFALPSLSPSYLDVIAQIAQRMPVHMLQVNPCRQYWGDIVSPRTVAAHDDPGNAYIETGHRLLASFGRPGRDIIDRLLDIEHQEVEEYLPPNGESLLAHLQADILDLQDRDGKQLPKLKIAVADRSVQVHSCYSTMREVEALHDQLLSMFETWPDLQPADVLVAVTDFARYEPCIDGVFGSVHDVRRIPWCTLGGDGIEADPLLDALLWMLDLPRCRFTATETLAPLDNREIRRRFDLEEEDIAAIRRWIEAAGVHWGWSDRQRAEHQVPAEHANTWQAGIERLLMGYALRGDSTQMFAGILPSQEAEGMSARTFSSLLDYLDALMHWRVELAAPHSMTKWAEILSDLIDGMFVSDDQNRILRRMRAVISGMLADARAGDCETEIELAMVIHELRQRLLDGDNRAPSPRGGVNVAPMSAMRGLPFEVICVLGMSDGVFPRSDRRFDFDLLRENHRRGDRSSRDEDRYLFLELMLSARRCLYLSYVGADIRSGATLPPSVLVSELIDVIERGYEPVNGGDMRRHLLTQHPLQAFSARYFNGDERLFSYRHENCITAHDTAAQRQVFLAEPLPSLDEIIVSPEEFASFFIHPVRGFLEKRMGLRLREYDETLLDEGVFSLDKRQSEALRTRIAHLMLNGLSEREAYAVESARGAIPPGNVGRVNFDAAARDAAALASSVSAMIANGPSRTIDLDITVECIRIVGSVSGILHGGLFDYSAVEVAHSWQQSKFWIMHLIVNAASGQPAAGHLYTLGKNMRFAAVSDPMHELRKLATLYAHGLCEPLHFFRNSAAAYIKARSKQAEEGEEKKSNAEPLAVARHVWFGNDQYPGECGDEAYKLVFADTDPIDAKFADLAMVILQPMFAAMGDA
jgi:exodeoxyribonuclease V gamma subunit